jgi:hypothetical protein
VQDIADQVAQHPILVRKERKPMNQSNALSKKSPVLQIKRFFSEPWFGFCNLAITAPLPALDTNVSVALPKLEKTNQRLRSEARLDSQCAKRGQ